MKPILYLLLCLIFISSNFYAQDKSADFVLVKKQKDWGFFVAPYVMFASQATDVGGEKIR